MSYEHKFKELLRLVKKMRDQQNKFFSTRVAFQGGYHREVDAALEQQVDEFLNKELNAGSPD